MEKYIGVTGKGQIAVKPDIIRLNLTLEDTGEKYEDTLEQSAIRVEFLKDCNVASGSYNINIQPGDINVSDTVTVVWQIG